MCGVTTKQRGLPTTLATKGKQATGDGPRRRKTPLCTPKASCYGSDYKAVIFLISDRTSSQRRCPVTILKIEPETTKQLSMTGR